MVIRIEMLNGEEDGEEKREEKWGNFGSPCPFFFHPRAYLNVNEMVRVFYSTLFFLATKRSARLPEQ